MTYKARCGHVASLHSQDLWSFYLLGSLLTANRFTWCSAVQLEKAQGQFARWQQLSKSNPDRKRLEGEIDDECRSIAWQVRCAAGL